HLGLDRERHVHRHLVTVEVGIVSRTDERVNADGLAFDQLRLEGLNRETVQGRCAVQENRVALGHFVKNVPDLGSLTLDQLLRAPYSVDVALLLETADDEGLEENERHLLRETALVELEFGTDDDHRTAGVIDALAEEVLPETSTLALEH